jgi:hypothetical protein
MKHDPHIAAASTQEGSLLYDDVILERGDYRIIVGNETRRCAKQFIVQKLQGGSYRNLSYHLQSPFSVWLGSVRKARAASCMPTHRLTEKQKYSPNGESVRSELVDRC